MQRKLNVVLVLLLVFGMAGMSFAGGAQESRTEDGQEQYVLTLSHHGVDYYQEGPKAFIKYVEEASNGRIVFEEHIMDALGSDADVMEMTAYGEIDITAGQTDSGMAAYMPSMQALAMPFLYSRWEVVPALFNSPFFEDYQQFMLEESGNRLRILSAAYGSVRNVYSTVPVRVPEDLAEANLKIRVMTSPLHMELWSALGATPVPVPSADRYMAIQTGLVNALDGGPGSAVNMNLTDFTKYTIMTNHIVGNMHIIINEDVYQSLPADLQQILLEGGRIANDVQNEVVPKIDQDAIDIMIERDVEIIYPTPQEMAEWRAIAEPVAMRILGEEVDPRFMEMLLEAVAKVEAEMQ